MTISSPCMWFLLLGYARIVLFNYALHVFNAILTDFKVIFVKYITIVIVFMKCFLANCKKVSITLVSADLSYGEFQVFD